MPSEECRSCRAEIWWAEKFPVELNDKGLPKTIPINQPKPGDPPGNIEVWRETITPEGGGEGYVVLYARYLRKGQQPEPGHKTGTNHFSNCPQAGQWRRK